MCSWSCLLKALGKLFKSQYPPFTHTYSLDIENSKHGQQRSLFVVQPHNHSFLLYQAVWKVLIICVPFCCFSSLSSGVRLPYFIICLVTSVYTPSPYARAPLSLPFPPLLFPAEPTYDRLARDMRSCISDDQTNRLVLVSASHWGQLSANT
jgi:hypothetical protein